MKNWAMLAALPAVALLLVVPACERLATEPPLDPHSGSHEILEIVNNNGYVVASETEITVGTVTATIDEHGGELSLAGKYKLTIPAGAVTAPTVFTMAKPDGDHSRFSLTATRGLVPNNVGAAGFAQPLTLTVSYAGIRYLPYDLSKLKVYWLKPDGSLEVQGTVLDTANKTVSGRLWHFSGFLVAFPQ